MPLLPNPNEIISRRIDAARIGDAAALGELFELCRNYLLLTANQELESELQAKVAPSDVVQETILEACRDFGSFRGSTEPEILAWMRQILLHNLANVRRNFRDTAKRELDREQPLWGEVEHVSHDVPTPATHLTNREQREQLLQALAQLPDIYREVLLLRQQEGCTFAEIGTKIGRTAESARKLWTRAVEQLKDILKSKSAIQ
ncbi:MAG: sigma-70 family RNA polymerase sigma factor [Planctomycetes bacterium]|nr:sigma-70 family RNA polymerase sigma factor [Planctomycetota bacterium]